MLLRLGWLTLVLGAVGLVGVLVVRGGDVAPRLVAVHAVPLDGTPVAGLTAAASSELGVVDTWFGAQHPNADGLRWQRAPDGTIDVAVVDVPLTLDEARDPFALGASLRVLGVAGPDDVLVVLVDVDAPTCGTTSTSAFGRTTAVLWLGSCGSAPSATTTAIGPGSSYVLAHEVTHALGAALPCSPNADDEGHVTDDRTDVLHAGPDPALRDVVLDPGNDDYFLAFLPDCDDVASNPLWQRG